MANMYINNMSDVWTSVGTSYSAIKMNVTNAASMTSPTISKLLDLQVGGSPVFTVDKIGGVVASGTITASGMVSATAPVPLLHDGAALGSAAEAWSDLYLASGGKIDWNNDDVTITHASETLYFAGAANGYIFDKMVGPTLTDAAALGSATQQWGDLYLASGGKIDWVNGDITLTHTANTLTMAGGDFTVTGNLSATGTGSVGTTLSVGGILNGSSNAAFLGDRITVGPTVSTGGAYWFRPNETGSSLFCGGTASAHGSYLQTFGRTNSANANDIILAVHSGTGVNGPGYRYFYDYSASAHYWASHIGAVNTNSMSLNSAGNLSITGQLTVDSIVQSTDATMIVASTTGGTIYFRPNGYSSTVEQVYINSNGTMVIDPTVGGIIVNKPTTSTSYAIIGYGNVSSGGVRGYCNNTSYYGILGYQTGGVAYSFYGAGQALNSTSWDVSDARAKSNITDCDCLDAYAKVRAIGVKSYSKASISEVGWLAQEIEKIIPDAVMDAGIPEDDTATREMVGGDTIKVTNDRTMLATLWAAFQHQTHLIEVLEAKVTALEAKGN